MSAGGGTEPPADEGARGEGDGTGDSGGENEGEDDGEAEESSARGAEGIGRDRAVPPLPTSWRPSEPAGSRSATARTGDVAPFVDEETFSLLQSLDAYSIATETTAQQLGDPASSDLAARLQRAEVALRTRLSPGLFCDLLATKHGFFSRGGRPDRHRAALTLLNEVVDGIGSGVTVGGAEGGASEAGAEGKKPEEVARRQGDEGGLFEGMAGQTMGMYRHQLPLWTLPPGAQWTS